MSPYRKTHWLPAAALSLCALTAIHCGGESSSEPGNSEISGDLSNVSLQISYRITPLIDSLVVDCHGADTLHYVADPASPYLEMDLFPHEHWTFKAKLYANGELMQTGELSAALKAGETADLQIQMHAIKGFVYIEIPLGFGNPTGIASGELSLDDGKKKFTYPMEIAGSTAVLKSGMLPLNSDYALDLKLLDSSGAAIYQASDSIHLDEASPVPELKIHSLRAKLSIGFALGKEVGMEFTLALPANRRTPKYGDVVISEVFAAPIANDSCQYEFIEVYNGSLDTLDLKNCTLGTTSIASKAWGITLPQILPGEVVVFGDSSFKTPEKYRLTEKWGSLGNSKGSVVIQCNGSILDSLYYSSDADSLGNTFVPALGSSKYGSSAQLNMEQWENRNNSDSWCLGTPNPGALDFCE